MATKDLQRSPLITGSQSSCLLRLSRATKPTIPVRTAALILAGAHCILLCGTCAAMAKLLDQISGQQGSAPSIVYAMGVTQQDLAASIGGVVCVLALLLMLMYGVAMSRPVLMLPYLCTHMAGWLTVLIAGAVITFKYVAFGQAALPLLLLRELDACCMAVFLLISASLVVTETFYLSTLSRCYRHMTGEGLERDVWASPAHAAGVSSQVNDKLALIAA